MYTKLWIEIAGWGQSILDKSKRELKFPPDEMSGGEGRGDGDVSWPFDVLAIEKALLNGFECRHPLRLSDAWMGLTNTGVLKQIGLGFNPLNGDFFLQDRSSLQEHPLILLDLTTFDRPVLSGDSISSWLALDVALIVQWI